MPQQDEKLLTPHYFKPKLYGIISVVAALAIAGVLLVTRYAALDLARDLKTWQDKLNLIADSRAGAVSGWVNNHFGELKKLSENPSLQLYFAELRALPVGAVSGTAEEPAQKSYIRNLLIFTADRMGFSPQNMPMSLQIPAQIPYEASSGVAVLDNDNNIIVSTPYLTALSPYVQDELKKIPQNAAAMIGMHKGEGGKVQMAFVTPIFPIQADPGASNQIGRIIGVKQADSSLFDLLKHPGQTDKTLEALLARKDGDNLTFLSPLADGSAPMEKALSANAKTLAEAAAFERPGEFIEGRDYQSRLVLATARSIPNSAWKLVLKIDRKEALAESQMRRNAMIVTLFLVLGIVVATVIAVWYIASSKRALVSSRYFRDTARRSQEQERLLKLVTDNQPESVFILDNEERYRFANRTAAKSVSMHASDMLGKPIGDVLGTARSEDITEGVQDALRHNRMQYRVRRVSDDGDERILKADYIPIEHIPVPGLPDKTAGVLVVEQDISDVVHEREHRIRTHRQLIDTLIMMVDMRDPHAANHSMMVAQIAHEVALAMELDHVACDTTRIAGSLMNIGKIVIPANVLTKRETLNEDELRTIRDSIFASAELLKDVSFEGPVVDTLRQAQERYDGTGPLGLKEDGILITARIIAAVNAFVGMISPRSYRAAMAVDAALKQLLEKVDTQFDRRVVVALANFIDNQGGRVLLEQLKREAA